MCACVRVRAGSPDLSLVKVTNTDPCCHSCLMALCPCFPFLHTWHAVRVVYSEFEHAVKIALAIHTQQILLKR